MKRFATILVLCCAATFGARAQGTLHMPADAKSMGMGGIRTTTLSASHAIYTNAASAAFSRQRLQLSGSYFSPDDRDCYIASGQYNIDNRNFLLAGWRQYRIDARNNDMSADLGYTRRIDDRWAVGVTARYLRVKTPHAAADALAADLSVLHVLPLEGIGHYTTLRIGGRLADIGGWVSGSHAALPLNLAAGAAFDTFVTDAHEVTLGVDAGYCFTPGDVRGFQASVGAEYNLMQLLQLRAGYHFGAREAYYPNYASLGAGVRFMHLRLDFAYLFAARDTFLRNTWSVSFGFDF
ncbi:PorV/PorQ family protein [uncultured Alistipes sp.]|uniref:PorV/PorQ family protein n=1 Tax=uncultured Alistipes sp. TaxID=538949 RepID=UPI00261E8688|nr:PorV/PorQ family protein [uncultured Alistipes sp.]